MIELLASNIPEWFKFLKDKWVISKESYREMLKNKKFPKWNTYLFPWADAWLEYQENWKKISWSDRWREESYIILENIDKILMDKIPNEPHPDCPKWFKFLYNLWQTWYNPELKFDFSEEERNRLEQIRIKYWDIKYWTAYNGNWDMINYEKAIFVPK